MPQRFLITGTAGFIGFHLAKRLLEEGHSVVGFDAMTDYYDRQLKQDRHAILAGFDRFLPVIAQLEDEKRLMDAARQAQPEVIIHLAGQAGVRHSIDKPRDYVDANLIGSFHLLEVARVMKPAHLLLASTSSVYGGNEKMPFAESDPAEFPMSFYAATKKAMEAMAHSYAHLWAIPTTCFRFFTVYGPYGRPDMALFKFAAAMTRNEPIEVYGAGKMKRDFTYIDDLVEAILRLSQHPPAIGQPCFAAEVEDTLSPVAPWRTVNIAGGHPVGLLDFIDAIEDAFGKTAEKIMLPMQPGDLHETFADHRLLEALTGYRPQTSLATGVQAFVDWYRSYYR